MIANIIAVIGLVLAVVIFIVTYLLFTETKKATKAATDSATAAQNTYTEQRRNDSLLNIADSINSYTDSINKQKQFRLDSTSTQAQIDALNESQKQFVKANDSYIEIGNFDTIIFRDNQRPGFKYIFENFGQPAKIEKGYTYSFSDTPNIYISGIYKRYATYIRIMRIKG